MSNFHVQTFPSDFNTYFNNYHNHKSKENVYRYQGEGLHLYAKWRVYTRDGKNKHLRMALFGELSAHRAIHLDGFPTLLGDQSGFGSGLIVTRLSGKFATSFTSGYTTFLPYFTSEDDEEISFRAGDALTANLSFGYLIYPRVYKSYDDVNLNIYLEVNSRFYDRSVVTRNENYLNVDQFKYLRSGWFACAYPGFQFILNSRTRLDVVVECPLYYSNDLDRFSMLMISIQRYFF